MPTGGWKNWALPPSRILNTARTGKLTSISSCGAAIGCCPSLSDPLAFLHHLAAPRSSPARNLPFRPSMCTPSIPQDNSAQLAQQQAAQRQSQITQGQQNIDQAFGQFNDDYFNNYAKTYENNYNPQVDEQFQRAQRQLNYNETRRGMQDSQDSIYHNDLLNENYGQQRQQVAANATSAENDLRNTVQNQKSQ